MMYGSHDEQREPADSDFDEFLALLNGATEDIAFDGSKNPVPEGGATKAGRRRSRGAKNAAPGETSPGTKRSVGLGKRLSSQSRSDPSSRSGSGGRPARSRSRSKSRSKGTKSGSTKSTGMDARRPTPRRGRNKPLPPSPPSRDEKDQGVAREDGSTSSSVPARVEGAASETKPSNGTSSDVPIGGGARKDSRWRSEGTQNANPEGGAKKDGRRRWGGSGAGQEQDGRRRSSGKRHAENVLAALEAAARPRASFSATHPQCKRKYAPMPTIFEVDPLSISSRSPRSVSVNVTALPRLATGCDYQNAYETKCHIPEHQIRSDAGQYTIGAKDYVPETALLANLRHRHIVKLHRRAMGFVVDKLDETLRDRMREWKEAEGFHQGPGVKQLEVAHAVADALAHLHSKNIVFRNLKPENVGFDRDGVAKLFNFGDATELPEGDGADPVGLLFDRCGTLRYMAPEVGLSLGYGPAADVYSFGVLLWELCTLAKPFASVASAAAFKEKVFFRGLRPEIDYRWPADVTKLILSCWSAAPRERPSMLDVKVALSLAIFRIPGEEGGAPARTVRSRLARRPF